MITTAQLMTNAQMAASNGVPVDWKVVAESIFASAGVEIARLEADLNEITAPPVKEG